jgi:hypothetical protein
LVHAVGDARRHEPSGFLTQGPGAATPGRSAVGWSVVGCRPPTRTRPAGGLRRARPTDGRRRLGRTLYSRSQPPATLGYIGQGGWRWPRMPTANATATNTTTAPSMSTTTRTTARTPSASGPPAATRARTLATSNATRSVFRVGARERSGASAPASSGPMGRSARSRVGGGARRMCWPPSRPPPTPAPGRPRHPGRVQACRGGCGRRPGARVAVAVPVRRRQAGRLGPAPARRGYGYPGRPCRRSPRP